MTHTDALQLTDTELAALCRGHGIRLLIPYSQLEAEAVRRGVELDAIVRVQLLHDLRKAGAI